MFAQNTDRTSKELQKFICRVCGYIYDEELGDPNYGIAPGTRFADIPDAWICAMCGEPKSEFQLMTEKNESRAEVRPQEAARKPVIVIGGGIAGWAVAEEIRKVKEDSPVCLITMDSGDYYYKPNLSVAWSLGTTTGELILESGAQKADKLGVRLISHTRVVGIDRHKRQLITDGGMFSYECLVVATGSKPRKLLKQRNSRIYSVNSLDDFAVLQRSLANYQELIVVGAGLIGCEIADDLSRLRKRVVLLNQSPRVLTGFAPDPIAGALQRALQTNGVSVHNGVELECIETTENDRVRCRLKSGEVIEADALLSCIGLEANAAAARLADLEVTSLGLRVNASMRTSDPNIFALGDCVDTEGVSLKYVDAIYAQAKVIASQFNSDHQTIRFQPKRSLVKIKTRSYPIWISLDLAAQPYTSWRVIAEQDDHFHLQLLQGDRPCGYALSGIFTQSPELSAISSQFLEK